VMIKQPATSNYLYADPKSALKKASDTLGASTCPFWKTVEAGKKEPKAQYNYYNDEPVNKPAFDQETGHTKGLYYHSPDNTGFWIIHSVPRFPDPKSTTFPTDEMIYGQSFLCISMTKAADWAVLATSVALNQPGSYFASTPLFPPVATAPASNTNKAKIGIFTVFAKSSAWNNELYSELVAPSLNTDLWVESWMRPCMEATCGKRKVLNIATLDFTKVSGWALKETEDHSKFAISATGTWVCIGDINRMTTQAKRGGGTACFENPGLHSVIQAAAKTDSCSASMCSSDKTATAPKEAAKSDATVAARPNKRDAPAAKPVKK